MMWQCLVSKDELDEDLIKDTWQLIRELSRVGGEVDHSNGVFVKSAPGNKQLLFFSPSAQVLGQAFGAKPCAAPSPNGMSLVAGDDRVWQIHFGQLSRETHFFATTHPAGLFEATHPSRLP